MFLSQNKIINEAPINGINKIDPGTINVSSIKNTEKIIINIPRKDKIFLIVILFTF